MPSPPTPPKDPEEWTDEQWLAWLTETDPEEELPAPPRTVARWRDRPAGQVLGAAMMGLRDAIYGRPDDEVVIVQESAGDPPDDGRPEVHLDPEHPERSEVVVRRQDDDERRRPGRG